jgi:hypothetical protein
MKRIFITLALVVFGLQFSVAQQTISTNQKSTCTYNGTEAVGCSPESLTATFTFKENEKQVILAIGGTATTYSIISRTYVNPGWVYRISNANGDLFDLKLNQRDKKFDFYPATLTDGSTIIKYSFL